MLRDKLKKIKVIWFLNAYFKSLRYRFTTFLLEKRYTRRTEQMGIHYSHELAIELFSKRILERKINYNSANKPNIFWIGSAVDQDNSGIIQALEKVSNLKIFYRPNHEYGFLTDSRQFQGDIKKFNDDEIYNALKKIYEIEKIDIIIGQMWADLISSSLLNYFRKMGIIVINIAMDDRLPEMWKDPKNKGSVGLGNGIDLVLTTAQETCSWYLVEGIPAIYWPLASSPDVFVKQNIRDIDISFIGNKYGYRGKIIEQLIKAGIKIEAFGRGWENGYVNAKMSSEILSRSKMSLGIGTIGHTKNMFTMKLRDFDVPMSGALYITHRTKELLQFFEEDREIICYEKIDDLISKIKFYLTHENILSEIADRGQKKAISTHTWEQRFEALIFLINKSIKEQYYKLDSA